MSVRVYLPTTLAGLAAYLTAGEVAAPFRAHAVTDAVRAEWGDSGGEEEWEYDALCLAADDARALWSGDDVRRRVVLALEAGAATPVDGDDPTLVEVRDPVPWRWVAAVHADPTESGAEADDDLCWFATQEAADLV